LHLLSVKCLQVSEGNLRLTQGRSLELHTQQTLNISRVRLESDGMLTDQIRAESGTEYLPDDVQEVYEPTLRGGRQAALESLVAVDVSLRMIFKILFHTNINHVRFRLLF